MKYKATLSTRNSTGQVESESKQEIKDVLESWFLQYEIDYRQNMKIEGHGKVPPSTHWQKNGIFISCNFEA